jgi:hypothetical protein
MKQLHMVTWLLVIIGGLNWLLLGLFKWDVGQLFGGMDAIVSKVIYILVGVSALVELFTHFKACCYCGKCENCCKPNNTSASI